MIWWDEDEKVVHVYSASPVTWRKMARLGLQPVRDVSTQGQPSGKFWHLSFSLFRWGLKGRYRGGGNPEALARAREARRQQGGV